MNTIKKILAVATIAAAMAGMAIAGFGQVEDSGSGQTPSAGTVQHYEYMFPDGNLYVYDIDNNFSLVKHLSIPTSTGTRGAAASAATGTLYVSYRSDNTTGDSWFFGL